MSNLLISEQSRLRRALELAVDRGLVTVEHSQSPCRRCQLLDASGEYNRNA